MTGSTKQSKPFLLGVAGGSGSGKTYFACAVKKSLGEARCDIVFQDNFYFDQSKKFDFDGGSINFDHPDSIDFGLLATCLKVLKNGTPTEIPIYDFSTHSRISKTLRVEARPIIIVDGILIFQNAPVRELFDELIYFDTPEDLRFKRRLERDMNERGRSREGVHSQFYKQVKPMHDQFVEPSKTFADIIVKDLGEFDEVLKDYCERLKRDSR